MYGKSYQAETILRKKKKRPFAKEVIEEVKTGEDLFNALFSSNIKDIKQKVKQQKIPSKRSHKNKNIISGKTRFAAILEQPEEDAVDSSGFLDPFEALFKGTRDNTEKNKFGACCMQSKLAGKVHEDEENSSEQENSSILEDNKNYLFFEPSFRDNVNNVTENRDSATLKRQPLKLKISGKDNQFSTKLLGKFKPNCDDSYIDLIDGSYDLDSLEDEFRVKRDELRKKREQQLSKITQDKSPLPITLGSQMFREITSSGSQSSDDENRCCERKESVVDFVSSTPAKFGSATKKCDVNKRRQGGKRENFGSEISTPARHVPNELPCLLSPIISLSGRSVKYGQKTKGSGFVSSYHSSGKKENKVDMKYWKKMFKKLNPTPVTVEKVTVQPYIHDYEVSDTDDSIPEIVECDPERKEKVSRRLQSPDPFVDTDVSHDSFHALYPEEDNLAKSNTNQTQLEEVHDGTPQSSGTCENMCIFSADSERNNDTQEFDLSDKVDSPCYKIIDERNQSKNCIDLQNTSEDNDAQLQDTTHSQTIKNVSCRRRHKSDYSNTEGNRIMSIAVNDSNLSSISEFAEINSSSKYSDSLIKFDESKNISESVEISTQDGCRRVSDLYQEMSKLSLFESRSSCQIIKKSFAPRRSHLVVPLAQNACINFERNSGFREVYFGTPLQKRCMDRNILQSQLDHTCSILKDDDNDDDNDGDVLVPVTFKDVVLEHCRQTDVLAFEEVFPDRDLADCKKIGEGVYGEVFARVNSDQQPIVMKIMPIEGDCLINGETQKSFEEILPEIVITMQLSNLRNNECFNTPNFPELKGCWCVQGRYPAKLLKLWNDYDEEKRSENDSPEILSEDQIYIVLELSNVGIALEEFTFNSAEQSWSAFMQVAYTLAVAELFLEFEHRDLHWGNILIKRTTEKMVTFKLDGEDQVVQMQGIQASVIDFTLSRITYEGCCLYNNLAEDPDLFKGQGDYQFDIYRMMQDKTGNNWQVFEPYNNVLWLSYVLEKLITEAYYRNEKTKVHKRGIAKLKEMKRSILNFKSAREVVLSFS